MNEANQGKGLVVFVPLNQEPTRADWTLTAAIATAALLLLFQDEIRKAWKYFTRPRNRSSKFVFPQEKEE